MNKSACFQMVIDHQNIVHYTSRPHGYTPNSFVVECRNANEFTLCGTQVQLHLFRYIYSRAFHICGDCETCKHLKQVTERLLK